MKILFDFGLVILIWLVQLIIYPSFHFIPRDQLVIWHARYTKLMTLVVLPLMLGQVIYHGMHLTAAQDLTGMVQGLLIVGTWLLTFLKAVPLHNQIQKGIDLTENISQLIAWNWPRTAIWTLIFILSFIQNYSLL